MKILHINTFDVRGGAGRALFRLHSGLQRQGVDSRILVRTKLSEKEDVSIIAPNNRKLEFFFRGFSRRSNFQDIYFPSTYNLPRHPWFQAADVINLHNIHGHYFAYPALIGLSQQRPIIWTLHDMWSLTGHCSYSFNCQRWKSGCGRCPYLQIYPALNFDTSGLLWRMKKTVFQRAKLSLVTPSRWLANLVQDSPLLGRFPIQCIPNSVDTDLYFPMNQQIARSRLKLPEAGFLVLFMAEKLDELRKGSDLLLAALHKLSNQLPAKSITLLTFGQGGETWHDQLPFPLYTLGSMEDEGDIAACYAAADIFILPTRQDNLPNGLLESQACGTPCVAFDVGGVSEVITHLRTGFLAEAGSIEALAAGIEFFRNDHEFCQKSRLYCRENAEINYALEVQAVRYIGLYNSQVKTERRKNT